MDKEEEYANEEQEENDLEEELYMIELHKRLVQMKEDRKNAETETKAMENRLNLLKGEEEKVSL